MSFSEFFQTPLSLSSPWRAEELLHRWMKMRLPADEFLKTGAHMEHCANLSLGPWWTWAEEVEHSPPEHIPFDSFGRRCDVIRTHGSWDQLKRAAAVEGIVATAYDRSRGAFARLHQMGLLFLFHPSSSFFSCPLAMTDGAAKVMELLGTTPRQKQAFKNLTSRDPQMFWTSGQWMTEKTGGSDVSLSRTEANWEGTELRLTGEKWFTSAITADMALMLARGPAVDESGHRELCLFYGEIREPAVGLASGLNGLTVKRLKNKLGTRALPTAELSLEGMRVESVGELGQGVKKISTLLNITRMYNSVCAISHMKRALDWLEGYAEVRTVFGKKLKEQPLFRRNFEQLQKVYTDCFLLTFETSYLLGRDECGEATDEERRFLRILTPIVKLYTAKRCVQVCSEVVEGFGGLGYIEDFPVARFYRDAQVFSIWEGTTSVLALDFLRAFQKENGGELLRSQKVFSLPSSGVQNFLQEMATLSANDGLAEEAVNLAFEFASLITGSLVLPA